MMRYDVRVLRTGTGFGKGRRAWSARLEPESRTDGDEVKAGARGGRGAKFEIGVNLRVK